MNPKVITLGGSAGEVQRHKTRVHRHPAKNFNCREEKKRKKPNLVVQLIPEQILAQKFVYECNPGGC